MYYFELQRNCDQRYYASVMIVNESKKILKKKIYNFQSSIKERKVGREKRYTGISSANSRKHLECAVCLNLLTDPRNLPCGHIFCGPKTMFEVKHYSHDYQMPNVQESSHP